MTPTIFAIAFVSGLIPALFWLWFWSREDKTNPEPWYLVIITFIAGMAVVPLALPLQRLAIELYTDDTLILAWVIIEEVLKYTIALIIILWHRAVDEPIDMVIYMIAIALGFSALENSLFILNPLAVGDFLNSTLTGAFRFLGATLLHVLASGTIGVLLAFVYYKSVSIKLLAGTLGLFIAIVLHGLFNLFIMDASGEESGEQILAVFLFVWIGVVMLFFIFEKIKRIETALK